MTQTQTQTPIQTQTQTQTQTRTPTTHHPPHTPPHPIHPTPARTGHQLRPVVKRDPHEPLSCQRQLHHPRRRVQALRRAAHHQHDRAAAPLVAQDLVAGAARGGAGAEAQEDLPHERGGEVDREGEDAKVDPGEESGETGALRAEAPERANGDDPVRVVREDVLFVRVEIHRLHEAERKVLDEPEPHAPRAEKRRAGARLGAPVKAVDPHQVGQRWERGERELCGGGVGREGEREREPWALSKE